MKLKTKTRFILEMNEQETLCLRFFLLRLAQLDAELIKEHESMRSTFIQLLDKELPE